MLLLLLAACQPKEDDPLPTCDAAASSAWTGDVTFEETTEAWGLADAVGGRMQAVDLDGDAYPDLVVEDLFSNVRDDVAAGIFYHRVFFNREGDDGGRTFVDDTEASGLIDNRDGTVGTAAGLYIFGDVDNDGDLDAYSGRAYDESVEDATGDCSDIRLNDGTGHFTFATASDVCAPAGEPVSAAAFTDYDADGTLDLWVVEWYEEYGASNVAGQDHLFHGNGDGTFTDVTDDMGLKLKAGRTTEDAIERDVRRPAYGATACDVDNDARPDLIATNYGRSWNQLWHNDGSGFTDIADEANFDDDEDFDYTDNLMYACYCNTHTCDPAPSISCSQDFGGWTPGYDDQPARLAGNSFTTVCADIDNDGDADLYTAEIAHDWAGDSADRSQLLLNDGSGTFTRVDNDDDGLTRRRPAAGWNEGDLYAAFFDFDNDGWKDIVLGSSDYEDTHVWLWRQTSAGQFEDVSDATGLNQPWPAGLAIADFDRDGDLDFVTGSSTARSGTPWTSRELHFYENTAPVGNWVRVEGLPIGTRVDVTAGGITQTQEVSGGYGLSGIQNDLALHFGLGDACLIDSIDATYPGGATQSWTNQIGNQALVLE
jgi:hypothetical protein